MGSSEKRVKGVIYVWFVQAKQAHKLQPIIKLDIYKTSTLNQRCFLWPAGAAFSEGEGVQFPCACCGCVLMARKPNQGPAHDEASKQSIWVITC